jgi:hypothetical protein
MAGVVLIRIVQSLFEDVIQLGFKSRARWSVIHFIRGVIKSGKEKDIVSMDPTTGIERSIGL